MTDATVAEAGSLRYLLRGQLLQWSAGVLLVATAWALAAPALGDGRWLGVADVTWFWAGIGVAAAHQTYTWLVFRAQLGWGLLTRWFGRSDLAVHGVVFMPLLIARPVSVLAIGLADRGSLALSRWLAVLLGVGLLLPTLYTLWSVRRYFGLGRALGGDHFRRSYRERPMVTGGAFGWSPNAMYTFAFLGLWALAFLVGSHGALVAALFQHAFIWAHYLGTERPDMALLYERT